MARIKCLKHGSVGAVTVCTHIESAIMSEARELLHDAKHSEPAFSSLKLCHKCKTELDQARSDAQLEKFADDLTIHCNQCVTDWMARFG